MGAVAELLLLLSLTLVTYVSSIGNHSIACFAGHSLERLEELRNIIICPVDQVCYFKYYLNDQLNLVIDAGCRSKMECKLEECAENVYNNRRLVEGMVVRARRDLVVCDECCYTGLCNKEGCGLALNLTQIPRRCFGRCEEINSMKDCLKWIECESENYMCSIRRHSNGYSLGCANKEICRLLMSIPNVPDTCCDSDLCNVIPRFENIFNGNVTEDVQCPNYLIPTNTTSNRSPTTRASTRLSTRITSIWSPTSTTITRSPTSTATTLYAVRTAPSAEPVKSRIRNHSIACFVGHSKARLDELTEIQICRDGEICYFKYYLDDSLNRVFDAGCRSKMECNLGECAEIIYNNQRLVEGTVIRAGRDLVICDECCYTGLCNKQGCGLVLNLTQVPRRCFGECENIDDMKYCLKWIECESEDYMCSFRRNGITSNSYNLGCARKEMCQLLMTIPKVPDTCCDSDLCNVIPRFEIIFHGNVTDDIKCPNNLIQTTTTSTQSPTPITSTRSPTSTATTLYAVTTAPPATPGTSPIPLNSTPRQLVPGIVIGRRAVSMLRPR